MYDNHLEGIGRQLLESGACYSKGESHHAEKYGNYGQGIGWVGQLVSPAGSLYVEGLGRDGIVMCNLEVIYQKEGICCTSTMGHNEEIPDVTVQSIWIWSVGNR